MSGRGRARRWARRALRAMNLRRRLVLALLGTVALLAVPAGYALNRLAELREIAFELRGQHALAFLTLGRVQRAFAEYERYQRSYVAAPTPELRAGAAESLARVRFNLDRLAAADYEEPAVAIARRLDVIASASARIDTLVVADRLDDATTVLEALKPELAEVQDALDGIARLIDRRGGENVLRAQRITVTAASTTLLIGLICVLLALALGLWTASRVAHPLEALQRAMGGVAEGSFVAPRDLPYDSDDEIGHLARSFQAMTLRLRELERLRAEYASIITHDLKTPINVIGGHAQLLEEGILGDLTERQREAAASIREQTHALAALADQFLAMSRAEAVELHVEPRPTESRAFFGALGRAFSAVAERGGVRFDVELDERLPERIVIDPDRMRDQVLGNLLSNAFKFTPRGGRVSLRAWAERGALHLEVADSGRGIAAADLPHVFEKFYRSATHRPGAGAGLGLTIAREVVQAHDGGISVDSQLGVGTTFRIVIPLRDASDAAGRRVA